MTGADYSGQAAAFIAEAERIAALGLPVVPDDPASASDARGRVRDPGRGPRGRRPGSVVRVLSEDEDVQHSVSAPDLSAAHGTDPDELAGRESIATLRETLETGPALSGFRPLPMSSP